VTSARGSQGGQITIDGGATGRVFSSGTEQATGIAGRGGELSVLGRNVVLDGTNLEVSGRSGNGSVHISDPAAKPGNPTQQLSLIDPHPSTAGAFGFAITPLNNGNVVVTNPDDDFVATRSGAVYLVQGETGRLLGALVGSRANDRIGANTETSANGRN